MTAAATEPRFVSTQTEASVQWKIARRRIGVLLAPLSCSACSRRTPRRNACASTRRGSSRLLAVPSRMAISAWVDLCQRTRF